MFPGSRLVVPIKVSDKSEAARGRQRARGTRATLKGGYNQRRPAPALAPGPSLLRRTDAVVQHSAPHNSAPLRCLDAQFQDNRLFKEEWNEREGAFGQSIPAGIHLRGGASPRGGSSVFGVSEVSDLAPASPRPPLVSSTTTNLLHLLISTRIF